MSDAGKPEYVPDRLYERLFAPWRLPREDWPLCREDWARVDAIARLPWKGRILDFGSGDGTLAAMVCSRNPEVSMINMEEKDTKALYKAHDIWNNGGYHKWPLYSVVDPVPEGFDFTYDGAMCCECLEHMTPEDGHMTLKYIHRCLRPGSMLCVTVPWEQGSRAEYPGHITKFSWALLGKMIRDAGFKLDERTTRDINGIWLMAIADA